MMDVAPQPLLDSFFRSGEKHSTQIVVKEAPSLLADLPSK